MSLALIFYAVVFFFFNYRFEADKIFSQPKSRLFATASADTTDKNTLVIGIAINGEAVAYPIRVIGYHHQVRDVVGNTPVMITYCTVCRAGRVYSPLVNGKMESFRLVGMDHFNAMFEDATTGTWWQQATGKAIAGPLKGTTFKEFASKQLTLGSWLREYPNSYVMQPDTSFKTDYDNLDGYDDGTITGKLLKRDIASWKPKSWVIGVINKKASKAYDWNELVETKMINDSVDGLPVMLALENDSASFHVYNRLVNGMTLHFEKRSNDNFIDRNTRSTWNMDGVCIDGIMKGTKLSPVQSYQEFWHSWSAFHPNTSKYNSNFQARQTKISFYDYL